jgi:predicted SnoaL-like aldol condensation-catalyzing enzyme
MTTTTTATERNKAIMLNVFREFSGGNVDILRTVVAEDFVEHSPGNPSGRDAFVEFLANARAAGVHLDLKRVIAEGEYVVFHSLMTRPGVERGEAVVDIFRLADGQLVEHWDVVQPVPDPPEVPNGML